MRFRRLELIPLLFIIAAVALLVSLGIWQVERLQWKNAMLADIERAQADPALGTLPACAKPEPCLSDEISEVGLRSGEGRPQDVNGIEYRNVALTGTFLNDKSLHMIAAPQGSITGFFIVTPFKLEDDGRIILVNRGFSPEGKESKPEGLQTVTGVIRPSRPKRYFSPVNRADKNVWFYEDVPAMAEATGLALTPIVVEAVGTPENGVYPTPNDGKIRLMNDHLQYAITWFALAIIAVVMFGLYHRVPKNKEAA